MANFTKNRICILYFTLNKLKTALNDPLKNSD